jgi:AcrR family transcriptional regulator
MQAKIERSFTESRRREQIVAAAIETIAEVGYQKASFAKIAKRAGLSSTGMISYHFAGKDDLVRAVTEKIVGTITAHMIERIEAADGRADRLRTYIETNIGMVSVYPAQMRALLDIITAARDTSGAIQVDTQPITDRVGLMTAELRDGQRTGEFGEFDARVTAIAITGAIDALVTERAFNPADDDELHRSAVELADLFLRAIEPRRTS